MIDRSDIVILWDTDHYSPAVNGGLAAAYGALPLAHSKSGRKLLAIEQPGGVDDFAAFMETGNDNSLPRWFASVQGFPYTPPSYSAIYRLQKSQYDGNERTQQIDVLPYDDRSRLKSSDELYFGYDAGADHRIVEQRNQLMAANIQEQLSRHDYGGVVISVGASHVWKRGDSDTIKDLDEMLAAHPKTGRQRRIANILVAGDPESAPGIFHNASSFPGVLDKRMQDKPDIILNYLPHTTPQEFSDRVLGLPLDRRQKITKLLTHWRGSHHLSESDVMQNAIDNRLQGTLGPEEERIPGLPFRNQVHALHRALASWDLVTAATSLSSIRDHVSNADQLRHDHSSYLISEGASAQDAAKRADKYVEEMSRLTHDTTELLEQIDASKDMSAKRALPPTARSASQFCR